MSFVNIFFMQHQKETIAMSFINIYILHAAPDSHPLNLHWSRLSITFPIKTYTGRLERSLKHLVLLYRSVVNDHERVVLIRQMGS